MQPFDTLPIARLLLNFFSLIINFFIILTFSICRGVKFRKSLLIFIIRNSALSRKKKIFYSYNCNLYSTNIVNSSKLCLSMFYNQSVLLNCKRRTQHWIAEDNLRFNMPELSFDISL